MRISIVLALATAVVACGNTTKPGKPADPSKLGELRALLDRTHAAASTETIPKDRPDVAFLVGMKSDEVRSGLGDPTTCAGLKAKYGTMPAPCTAEADWFYSFYRLPDGYLGGGAELLLEIDGDHVTAARWMFTQ